MKEKEKKRKEKSGKREMRENKEKSQNPSSIFPRKEIKFTFLKVGTQFITSLLNRIFRLTFVINTANTSRVIAKS